MAEYNTPDSRVTKMATFHAGNNDPDDHDDFVAKCTIRDIESAGLLVLDPAEYNALDSQVRQRLVVLIHDAFCPNADCREDPMTYSPGEFAAADAVLAKFLVLDSNAIQER